MKKLFIILLVLCTINLTAQTWKRPVKIILYHTSTIALGAVGDAVYDNGNKNLGHALKGMEVGALIAGPFINKIQKREALDYILSYGFLRFSFFDAFYNMSRDLPLLYNGTTSNYDKIMNQMPPHGRAWYKGGSLMIGISLPLNKL